MAKCRAKHLHTSIQVALWWKSLILIACGANQMEMASLLEEFGIAWMFKKPLRFLRTAYFP